MGDVSASRGRFVCFPDLVGARVVVDGGAPRVDEGDELILHVELLHPRESQRLNASMIPKNPSKPRAKNA